jgi:hypothetical protein
VAVSALLAPVVQYDGDSDYRSTFVFVWNTLTRFVLLEIIVLTLGRIRRDFKKTGYHVK